MEKTGVNGNNPLKITII